MRIGISTSVIQRGKTGVSQYVLSLIRALLSNSAGHQFTLYVLEEDLPLFEFCRGRAALVSVPERYRPAVRNIVWHQAALPRLARRDALDVLHVPSYRRLLWTRPCAMIGTIHDLAPFHVSGKYDLLRMLYGRHAVRCLARRQDRIIAVSQTTAADISRFFGVPSERIEVIHNGLNHDVFSPGDPELARADVAKRFGLVHPFFLYVARLEHPGKNHVRLIEAFSRFKKQTGSRWQLALAGSDWNGAEAIHAAVHASPFRGDIRCMGFVRSEDLPTLYRAAGAFVYPSLFEGFGIPPIEAMACGCPVICSDRGALAEVVGDAALIVIPENVPDIAEKLAAVESNTELRLSLRQSGLKHAAKFSWGAAAEKTLRVYQRVASPRIVPRAVSETELA